MNSSISIALCTYNGEKYIEDQILSMINQTIKPDEIILCDDCSTDSTVEIARRLLENSGIDFQIIENIRNLGYIKNFEKAIGHCSKDIIFTAEIKEIIAKK